MQQLNVFTNPQFKFFIWLIKRWWMLPVRYNFLSLSCYGGYPDRSVRDQFRKPLPFVDLFDALYRPLYQKECILVFDPGFVPKSGKQTPGLYKFWNGTHQRAEKGLEAGILWKHTSSPCSRSIIKTHKLLFNSPSTPSYISLPT
jgi:hypothetical protein